MLGSTRVTQPFRVSSNLVSSGAGIASTVPAQALTAGKGVPLQIIVSKTHFLFCLSRIYVELEMSV